MALFLFLLTALLCLVVQPVGAFTVLCGPFKYPNTNFESVFQQHDSALLQLGGQRGKSVGTGFLVDSSRGYVVTAYHVAAKALRMNPGTATDGKTLLITGYSNINPEKELKLSIYADDIKADVAVLQLEPPDALSNAVGQFELSLSLPSKYEAVKFVGFPLGQNLIGGGQISGLDSEHNLTVASITLPGASGSPVINSRGLVIGIVTAQLTNQTAVIKSTLGVQELLAKIPPSATAEKAFQALAKPPKDFLQQFIPFLLKDGLSNLDIFSIINRITKKKAITSAQQESIFCPIYRAAIHRELEEPAMDLHPFLPVRRRPEVTNIRLQSGTRALELGESGLGNARVQIAKNEWQGYIVERITSKPGGIIRVACTLARQASDIETITKSIYDSIGLPEVRTPIVYETEACERSEQDNVLANYLRNWSLAKVKLDEDKTDASVKASIALATLLSGDARLYAENLALLGDTLQRENDHETAVKAYAGAYQNGKQSDWVLSNYNFSNERLPRGKRYAIGAAPILDRNFLYNYVGATEGKGPMM